MESQESNHYTHTWSRAEMYLRVGREGTVLFFEQAVPLKKQHEIEYAIYFASIK